MTCKDCLHYAPCYRYGNIAGVVCHYFKPKADFFEIVQCENCKHGEVYVFSKSKDGKEDIAVYCNVKNKVTSLDGWCACGERRE